MEQSHTDRLATDSDHPLRMMIDHMPTLAWSCRPDGTTALLNQRWLDYTGLSMAQALDQGWHGPIHPDDLGTLRETWARLRASGAPGEAEARLRRGDSAYRWYLFRAVPVRDELGHLVHWSGMATDIEDRKQAEAAMQWSKALLAGEKRVLDMIAHGEALPHILEALCRVVEAQASDILSSCLVLDVHGTHLRHAAAPRLPQSYIDAIDGVGATLLLALVDRPTLRLFDEGAWDSIAGADGSSPVWYLRAIARPGSSNDEAPVVGWSVVDDRTHAVLESGVRDVAP